MIDDYTLTQEERARKAARAFADAVNEIGFNATAFADELARQHRTLQQNSFRTIGAVLRKMSQDYEAGYYDLRNEHSLKSAKKIVGTYGDELMYIPHV